MIRFAYTLPGAGARCACGRAADLDAAGLPLCDRCGRRELARQLAHEAEAHGGRFARYRRVADRLVCLRCVEGEAGALKRT